MLLLLQLAPLLLTAEREEASVCDRPTAQRARRA